MHIGILCYTRVVKSGYITPIKHWTVVTEHTFAGEMISMNFHEFSKNKAMVTARKKDGDTNIHQYEEKNPRDLNKIAYFIYKF